jgi:prephenate dehydrogenase
VSARVLGVAGVGLIGGSIALRARAAGLRVIGFDRDPAALAAARAAGGVDETVSGLAELAERSAIVALALPVDAVVDALTSVDALARPELVFDVASVKVPVASAARRFPRFVGSHPLAGREIGGFAAADAALFVERTWVVTPGGDPAARALLAELIAHFGARPVELDAATHDRLVAATSHLPQLLSVLLGERLAELGAHDPRAYDLAGPGIRSMLRLARSPASLWTVIARANAGPLAAELRNAAQALENLAAELERAEVDTLASYFARAGAAVDELERRASGDSAAPRL